MTTTTEPLHRTSRRGRARKPTVTLTCPANARTGDNERIIEFSFPGLTNGSSCPGGLISLRETADGTRARVEVYRTDGQVEVIAPTDQTPTPPATSYWAAYAGSALGSEITLHRTRREALEAVVAALGLEDDPEDDVSGDYPPIAEMDDDDLTERISTYCEGRADDWEVCEVEVPR